MCSIRCLDGPMPPTVRRRYPSGSADVRRETARQRKDHRETKPTSWAVGESTLMKQPMHTDSKARTRKTSNTTKTQVCSRHRAARRLLILDISPSDRYVSTQAVRVLTLLR